MGFRKIVVPDGHELVALLDPSSWVLDRPEGACCLVFLTRIPEQELWASQMNRVPHGGCGYVDIHPVAKNFDRLKKLIEDTPKSHSVGLVLGSEFPVTAAGIERSPLVEPFVRIGIDNNHFHRYSGGEFCRSTMQLYDAVLAFLDKEAV
jgi:hypothetical protein